MRQCRIVSTAKKEFSGNEPCEAVRRKVMVFLKKKTRPKYMVSSSCTRREEPGCVSGLRPSSGPEGFAQRVLQLR